MVGSTLGPLLAGLLPGLMLALPLMAPPAPAIPASPEGRWGDGRLLQPLPFSQSHREPLQRARYALIIPPDSLPPSSGQAGAALRVVLPPRFDGRLLPGAVRLCRIVTRPQAETTHCTVDLAARVEAAGPRQLRVVPLQPLAPRQQLGLVLLLFNPSLDGLYPLRLWSDPAGTYVGTWLIPIEADGD